MLSTTSDSENSQNDSEHNFFLGNVFEVEDEGSQVETVSHEVGAIHADVPLTGKSWLKQYNRESREIEEKERELLWRLEGSVLLKAWYKLCTRNVVLSMTSAEPTI